MSITSYSKFVNNILNERKEVERLSEVSFNYNDEPLTFSGNSSRDTYKNMMIWFLNLGYFNIHSGKTEDKIFTTEEIQKNFDEDYRSRMSKIPGTDYWFYSNFSTVNYSLIIKNRLKNIEGIDIDSIEIKIDGKNNENEIGSELSEDDTKKRQSPTSIAEVSFNYNGEPLTFSGQKDNGKYSNVKLYDNLMIWYHEVGYFKNNSLKTFDDRLFTKEEIDKYLIDSPRYKNTISRIPNIDVYYINWWGTEHLIKNIKSRLSRIPGVDINSLNIKVTPSISDNVERLPERETNRTVVPPTTPSNVKESPFKQAICVIGESGAGKSVTVRKILEHDGHVFHFIIPTSTTTGLLSQFSPREHSYVPSVLGEMIIEAANNPNKIYTAVFDECHKSNVIEMINDELLQCISTERNLGDRFITLDRNTIGLYKGEAETSPLKIDRYNIYLPDNFGFIFISSKTKVIANNEDFFNRVDIVRLTTQDRGVVTSTELLEKVLPPNEKNELKSSHDF